MVRVLGEPDFSETQQERFAFLSRYLFDSLDYTIDLRLFEVLAWKALESAGADGFVDGEVLLDVADRAKAEYDIYDGKLSREQIFTFVKHHYDHGV